MNRGKHPKNFSEEGLEAEESLVPTRSRSAHLLAAYIKLSKPGGRKFRQILPEPAPQKPEAALIREPAPAKKPDEKHSQATSREHLLKLERLMPLRAPFAPKRKSRMSQTPVTGREQSTAPAFRPRPPRRRSA